MVPLVDEILKFWKDKLFLVDSNITPIMYCASLIPGVFINGYYKFI